jgi:hypothetical protein
MQSNEPDALELSLFYKLLVKKVIFQQKIATDLMGKRSTRTGRDKHAISGIDGDEAHKAC